MHKGDAILEQEDAIVFVLARDWILRTAVRAELRERGIDALGMDSPDDAGRALASGQVPAAIVVEGIAEFASHAAIESLISRVPTVWIASRTERIPDPTPPQGQKAASTPYVGTVLYRPVRINEVVETVLRLIQKGHPA